MSFSSGNPIVTLNGMEAEVILASVGHDNPRITTMRIRCPRIIWPEVLTHRLFNRNARSSRAVPFKKLLAELRLGAGFTPWHWTADQKGMQGVGGHDNFVEISDALFHRADEDQRVSNTEAWSRACDHSAEMAEAFSKAKYHKQLCNRLIEPFVMIDAVITATDWENFFWLRDHEAAEPHLQDLAQIMKEAYDGAHVQTLEPSEWHLPYVTENDHVWAFSNRSDVPKFLRKISAARCARVSYAPFDGDASYEAELRRHDLLVMSDRVHASPLEHQATPDYIRSMACSPDAKTMLAGTAGKSLIQQKYQYKVRVWENAHQHGSLNGWIQNRKLVPNEAKHG